MPGASTSVRDSAKSTRFDLAGGLPGRRISLNGYVDDLFDLAYATSIISAPGLNLRFFNPPRTAGVRFKLMW